MLVVIPSVVYYTCARPINYTDPLCPSRPSPAAALDCKLGSPPQTLSVMFNAR